MGRPSLTRGERANRQKVGQLLKALRIEAGLSLRAASAMISGISPTRLWQIEEGLLPYDRVIGRITGPYAKTPEEIIRLAHGQLSLDLVGTILGTSGFGMDKPVHRKSERYWARVTLEEKELLDSFLSWVRLRREKKELLDSFLSQIQIRRPERRPVNWS